MTGHLSSTMTRVAEAEAEQLSMPSAANLTPPGEPVAVVADPIDAPFVDLPPIGTSVQFTLRGQEYRGARNRFASMITNVHPETGFVDLVVVLGADDMMDQKDVPRLTEANGWGWQPIVADVEAVAALERRFNAFQAELSAVLFGPHVKAEESVYSVLVEHEERLLALEPNVTPLKAKAKQKRRG